jgi:hypothetical protein
VRERLLLALALLLLAVDLLAYLLERQHRPLLLVACDQVHRLVQRVRRLF